MGRMPTALFFLVICWIGSSAQTNGPAPFQTPTVSRTHIAFAYAGNIWIVERAGGTARRLTTQPGRESRPVLSPDGSEVAYTRNVGGSVDIYVVPASGGEPRQLTYHPKAENMLAWSADGKNVMFSSARVSDNFERLYTVPSRGGFETELGFQTGVEGAFSPDGARIAYVPFRNDLRSTWRNYRGGGTTPIWIARLSDGRVEEVPRTNSNDFAPMWIGEMIYFVSDRTGTFNLFGYDTRTRKIAQLTRYEKYDIRAASANAEQIVFVQDGAIRLYDIKTNQTRTVEIQIAGEFPEVKPRAVKAGRWIRSAALSPDGSKVVLGVRGEVVTMDVEKGTVENLTQSSGIAERSAVWSPDGTRVAYFSDESGEYQLHIRPLGGSGVTQKIKIETQPSFYGELTWSADSKKLAFSDKRLSLWYVDLDQRAARKVDSSTHAGQDTYSPAWSADGEWIAYSKALANRLRSVFLYSLKMGKSFAVTDGRCDSTFPVFDRNGKYLYFLSSSNAGPAATFGMSSFVTGPQVTSSVYFALLRKDLRSPMSRLAAAQDAAPESGGNGIDIDGISNRILPLPLPSRDYSGLAAGKSGILFVTERDWSGALSGDAAPVSKLQKFDLASRKTEEFVPGAENVGVSSDGGRLIFSKGQTMAVVSTDAAPKADSGRLDLTRIEIQVDPRAEWNQMFNEIWRIQRDYFYDEGLHGQNLGSLRSKYAAYLPNVMTREDLNYVFREALSHLSISHMGASGGDIPPPGGTGANAGLLGADFTVEQGRYRIKRIYRDVYFDWRWGAPLSQPGVDIREGEYLLSVDGEEVLGAENLYKYFLGKAGRPTQLKVGPNPSGEGARTVIVAPTSGENTLRRFNWVEDNRRRVEELSGGKLAYVYLPNFGSDGLYWFRREYYGQIEKQGIVIDLRYGPGGSPADYIIEALTRTPLSYYAFRNGVDMPFPVGVMRGPKVVLINQFNVSSSETFPWLFRAAGLGKLVGKPTIGGGIGGYVATPQLIDGGNVSSPNRAMYNPVKGAWDIENGGVAPDIDVEFPPSDWRLGRDPQLEKAVAVALEELKKHPPLTPGRPKYPTYK